MSIYQRWKISDEFWFQETLWKMIKCCSVGLRPFPRTSRGFLNTLTGSECFELGAWLNLWHLAPLDPLMLFGFDQCSPTSECYKELIIIKSATAGKCVQTYQFLNTALSHAIALYLPTLSWLVQSAVTWFSTSPLLNPVAECISTEVYSYYVYVDNYLVGKLPSAPVSTVYRCVGSAHHWWRDTCFLLENKRSTNIDLFESSLWM